MNQLRLVLPSLALAALTASGCFLVSGQFLVKVDLDSPLSVDSATQINGLYVDLSSNSIYNDHKDKIKDLADFALLGRVHNTGSSDLQLDLYMFEGDAIGRSLAQILLNGTKVWGSLTVPAGATVDIGWDQSAALFGSGKAPLLNEIKSGGAFTLYAVSNTSSFTFTYTNGVFVAVLSAGT